jgi:urease accessory protein
MTVSDKAFLMRSGVGALEVSHVAGQSAVVSCNSSSPVKILAPHPRGKSVWAYLSSFGGGMVGGDHTQIEITVNERARCFFSTQASTKIYRNSIQFPCSQTLSVQLAPQSLLVLFPDVLQPFANGSYSQKQHFQLDPSANLVTVDWFSAGRVARGERWSFRRLESRNEISIGTESVFRDSLLLDPALAAGSPPMGRYNCVALVVMVGGLLTEMAERQVQRISALPVAHRAQTIESASRFREGVVLRVAGLNVEEVANKIQAYLKDIVPLLGDDPWKRKW